MKIRILTPEVTVYDDSAEEIIVDGVDGRFGVLDHHAPMLASLKDGHIRIRKGSEWTKLDSTKGTFEVQNNSVTVLLQG